MNHSEQVAKILLELEAVKLNTKIPFEYTSGIKSPIYCDNRIVISHPKQRTQLIELFLETVKSLDFDVVAGTATAGIPHAAWIADHLKKPMVYVRTESKSHGTRKRIEGGSVKDKKVLLIEDLVSTGGSASNAGLALREQGADITDCVAIFSYEMESATRLFSDAEIVLHTLCTFSVLLKVALEEGVIDEDARAAALKWHQDPEHWQPQSASL